MTGTIADPFAIAEVTAAERALYQAMIDLDYPALERMLSPDLVYIHSTGVAETRDEYLAALAKGCYEYETIASHDLGFHVHGDCAIVHGVVDMLVGAFGQAKALIHLLFVFVWTREDEQWKLSYRQATRIP